MPFVLDASVAACWAFPDEQDPRTDEALARARTEDAVVPALWWFEVRDILIVNERRKRTTESHTYSFLRDLGRDAFSSGLRARGSRRFETRAYSPLNGLRGFISG